MPATDPRIGGCTRSPIRSRFRTLSPAVDDTENSWPYDTGIFCKGDYVTINMTVGTAAGARQFHLIRTNSAQAAKRARFDS